MPTMDEIYKSHAEEYHELVSAEDYEGNLARFLLGEVRWKGGRVLEAGVGTGRLTDMYIDEVDWVHACDRSRHMLEFAEARLSKHGEKIEFSAAENTDLPLLPAKVDLFIEGWSFGHTVSDAADEGDIPSVTRNLVQNATKNVADGGTLILIESLGTNVDSPVPPNDRLDRFYEKLEEEHGFTRHVIRTDYRFRTNEEAVRVMGFFFGHDRVPAIRARKSGIIPEWTGVWTRRKT